MDNIVEKLLKLNENEQKGIFRSFSRFSLSQRIDILPIHNNILHKLKQNYSEMKIEIISYSALVMAIQIVINEQKTFKTLDFRGMSLDEIKRLSSKRAKLFLQKQPKLQTKREQLLSYWSIVSSLKNDENYSFRQISAYLQKYHRFTIAYSSIYNLWNELNKTGE